ncbi:transporter substrate-binding domain-containing protein [Bacillus sp. 31A1R]|uniref:Transporter substrate-binding domain-containing protein n=1 Tax=Robertmurraya mangrovi TaxID=3098077 RepID=A0ABU5J3S6_9BACI|nr:transporter substrate-binding domain-containing protein [Bacillus sp. 31A1R]MDZ5474080.1 transporter substrate-binding domain-containing protein [Bacillus sp. 31A1R]
MKRIFNCMFFVLMASFLLIGCSSKTDNGAESESGKGKVLANIKDTGKLTVGFEGAYMPFNFLKDNGKDYDGFDVDISSEIAKRLGVEVEFVATPWDGLIGGLKADKFDIIIAQMSITEERKKSVDFTDPYVETGGVLITRNDTNDITKLEDIAGKKVGVGGGTTFEEVVRGVSDAKVQTYKNVNEYIQDLMNGRLDVIMNDQLVMGYNIKNQNLPIKITSDIVNKDLIGMAVKKGNEDFISEVNKALAEMKKDGTYTTIYKKWFGVEPTLQ